MIARPVDASGDILPVLSPSDLLSDLPAVAAGLSDHLRLFSGDWWEYADRGNEIFDLIAGSRLTEKDIPALSGYLTSYLMDFPEVYAVSDVTVSVFGNTFSYSAVAHISPDSAVPVSFSFPSQREVI